MATEQHGSDFHALSRRVADSLMKAEGNSLRLRSLNTRLLVASIISSAASTLVAGITAANGPIVGAGPMGWRISCIVAAVFGFLTTVCVAMNQQLKLSDRLAQANECAGRLKSLDVAIATSSREWPEIAEEYQEIVRIYPEPIR